MCASWASRKRRSDAGAPTTARAASRRRATARAAFAAPLVPPSPPLRRSRRSAAAAAATAAAAGLPCVSGGGGARASLLAASRQAAAVSGARIDRLVLGVEQRRLVQLAAPPPPRADRAARVRARRSSAAASCAVDVASESLSHTSPSRAQCAAALARSTPSISALSTFVVARCSTSGAISPTTRSRSACRFKSEQLHPHRRRQALPSSAARCRLCRALLAATAHNRRAGGRSGAREAEGGARSLHVVRRRDDAHQREAAFRRRPQEAREPRAPPRHPSPLRRRELRGDAQCSSTSASTTCTKARSGAESTGAPRRADSSGWQAPPTR